jgi:hypothetical protein
VAGELAEGQAGPDDDEALRKAVAETKAGRGITTDEAVSGRRPETLNGFKR